MLETALIVFREGLESFLIVAVTLAYLVKTGRSQLAPAVYAGIIAALALSIGIGMMADEMAESPATEGGLALLAGVLVATMTYHVMRTAKTIRTNINAKLEYHSTKAIIPAMLGLFAFTVLMIAREGMETALMLSSLIQDSPASTILTGAGLGLLATAIIGYLWVKNAHLINLKLFLQATGIFLIVFSIHLAIFGLHEMSEADALPFIDNFAFHTATEEFAENDSVIGQLILFGMIILPCAWLGISILQDKFKKTA